MTKPLRTQFVVVDGARARWIRRSDETRDFVTENEIKAPPRRPSGGPEGVVFDRAGGGRHTVEGRDQSEKDAFAARVVEALNDQAERGAFERLAIVAPARTLGRLREDLSPVARQKLSRTLAKDLTKVPDHDLAKWLRPLEL